jgi:hypothetical protein
LSRAVRLQHTEQPEDDGQLSEEYIQKKGKTRRGV